MEKLIDLCVLILTRHAKEDNRTCRTFWVRISNKAGTRVAVDVINTTCAVETR